MRGQLVRVLRTSDSSEGCGCCSGNHNQLAVKNGPRELGLQPPRPRPFCTELPLLVVGWWRCTEALADVRHAPATAAGGEPCRCLRIAAMHGPLVPRKKAGGCRLEAPVAPVVRVIVRERFRWMRRHDVADSARGLNHHLRQSKPSHSSSTSEVKSPLFFSR